MEESNRIIAAYGMAADFAPMKINAVSFNVKENR